MVSLISVASGTRGVGLLGYAASTAACAWAWRRTAQKRAWLTLACIQLWLLLDLVFNWRWKLHDGFVALAMAGEVYDERRRPQEILLTLVLVLIVVLAVRLWRHFRRRGGLTLAVVATAFSVALRVAEMISWHEGDALLHHAVAGAMVVTYLWFVLGAATAAGVWIALQYPASGWR